MELAAIGKAGYENGVAHGFYENPKSFVETMMLIVSELAEAVEEYRSGHGYNETYYNPEKPNKPEGIPIELADAAIRLLDECHYRGIDIEAAIALKMAYNVTRPYKHGGKLL